MDQRSPANLDTLLQNEDLVMEGLQLIRAFVQIAGKQDRQSFIDLAERLSRRTD